MKRYFILLIAMICLFSTAACAESLPVITLADNASSCSAEGVIINGNTVRILKAGEYILTGSLSNGCVSVECDADSKVKLYLDDVRIHNETGAAIYIGRGMSRVSISLEADTDNVLSNGENLVFTDSDKEPNGVIFSRSDLTVTGEGRLTVQAGALDGIVSKDDLRIKGGSITVTAARHAIRGKDYVQVSEAVLTLEAGKDALRTTEDSRADRGYIQITDSTVNITCGDDAFSYVTRLTIQNAAISCVPADDE